MPSPTRSPPGHQGDHRATGHDGDAVPQQLKGAENTFSDDDQTVRAVYDAIGALPADSFARVERVAAGIRTAVESKNPPRRLALNRAGADAMKTGLEARIRDIDDWAAIAASVDAA